MSKKRKKKPAGPIITRPEAMVLLELRLAVMQHCTALKFVAEYMAQDKKELATSRLDQAVHALEAVVRGTAVGVTMPCPGCGEEQDITAWLEHRECSACFHPLIWPSDEGGL